MRWLVVHPGPAWSVADVHNGITEALRAAGEDVMEFNLDHRLQFFGHALLETGETGDDGSPVVRRGCTNEQALSMAIEPLGDMCWKWWPHVVLGISAFFTPPGLMDLMRERGHTVVLWHTESPYQDGEQLARAAHADLNLINDPATLPAYRALGRAEYMPHSYRPSVHHPGPGRADLKCDLAFVGTGFPSRRQFLEAMDLDGLDVLLAGNWPGLDGSVLRQFVADEYMTDERAAGCLDNADTADLYRSARAGINLYRREGEQGMTPGTAMGPREIEMAACGLFFLRDRRPESDEVLGMLPSFDGPQDASVRLRWWLAHDDARERAAAAAREAVAGRTFDHTARRLIGLVKRLRGA